MPMGKGVSAEEAMDERRRGPAIPDPLVFTYLDLLKTAPAGCPVIDLACGDGHNGLFLASQGLQVTLADRAAEMLQKAEETALALKIPVTVRRIDLEQEATDPLDSFTFGAVIVFRYLHRPLIPCIRRSLMTGGVLLYETFTAGQAEFGRPHNPSHLLQPGELRGWFSDWEIIHYFEGIAENPRRAIAQLVCRKPYADDN